MLASCSISKGVLLYSQDSHTSSNEAVISKFHISSEARSKSALPLSPVDRMGDTEYAGRNPDNRVLANSNVAVRRVCDVAVPVDEARWVNVDVRSVVDANR